MVECTAKLVESQATMFDTSTTTTISVSHFSLKRKKNVISSAKYLITKGKLEREKKKFSYLISTLEMRFRNIFFFSAN
jgi:hypothetical protein